MQPLDYQQIAFAGRLKEDASQAAIQKICVLYLFCWTIAPILAIGTIWRILALISFIVWYSLALQRGFKINTPVSRAIGFAVLVSVVILLTDFKVGRIIKRIDVFMLVIAICMFQFYLLHPLELLDLIPYLLFMLTIFNFKTGDALLENAQIARLIVRNSEEAQAYQMQGIGGYCLLYLQVCACPAILAWGKSTIKSSSSKKLSILFVCWLLSYLLFIYKAAYSIALFASALSFFLVLPRRKANLRQSLIIMIVLFVLLMAAILFIEPFRELLFDIFRGTAVERKLHDFSVMNGLETNDRYGSQNYGSFDTRSLAYSRSLWMILQYPIIGGLFFSTAIGGHSAILDTIARYGWLGGWLYCSMIFAVPIAMKKSVSLKSPLTTINNATFVIILFIALLDTLPYENTFNVVMLNAVFFFALLKTEQQTMISSSQKDNPITSISSMIES